MRARWSVTFGGFAALLISAAAAGQTARSPTTIGVDELRPGMRGYGLTVFRGTTPERFEVEVVDVLQNFRPDQDLILVRTEHPILDHAQVVAGMSGSPIYFDNRLAGAYAYGWTFSRDPIAGVTPIETMLTELRRATQPGSFPGAQPLAPAMAPRARPRRAVNLRGLPAYTGDRLATSTTALEHHIARFGSVHAPSATLTPAATPLLIGGLDDDIVRTLDQQLGDLGLMVLQAGGGGSEPAPDAPTRFVDGGSMSVELVRGDVSASGIGTVTHVAGSRMIGFGHPMMNAGEVGFPTAISRVVHILASVNRSIKMGEAVRSLGTMIHDRQSAVVIDMNVRPATVPVRLRVTGIPGSPRDTWNMEIASHRVLTPVLIGASIAQAIKATTADTTDMMFEATSRVWIAGERAPIEVTDVGFSRIGVSSPAALSQLRLFSLLEAAYGNPFEDARVERVDVEIAARFARETVEIIDASVASEQVDPGTTVPIRVVMRRFGQPEHVRIVPVAIPQRAAGQRLEVFLQGGGDVDVVHPQPRNLQDIVRSVQDAFPRSSLVASVQLPTRGLRFAGHVVGHLPGSALDALQLRNDGDRNRPFVTFDRHEIPLGEVVSGTARVELSVRRSPRP